MNSKLIPAILLTLLFLSCTSGGDGTCSEMPKVMLHINFYDVSNPLAIDSLTVQGVGSDSLIVKKRENKISLPLKKFENETAFILTFNNIADTVTFRHSNSDFFISFACGCEVVHMVENAEFTHNFIDSLQIINPQIRTADVENIKIYHF